MDLVDDGRGEESARDARLIADQHDRQAGAVQHANRVDRVRKKLDAFRPIEIADFLDDRAVAVEEDRALERLRHSIFRVAASASAAGTPSMQA